jgi:hypothetical protein
MGQGFPVVGASASTTGEGVVGLGQAPGRSDELGAGSSWMRAVCCAPSGAARSHPSMVSSPLPPLPAPLSSLPGMLAMPHPCARIIARDGIHSTSLMRRAARHGTDCHSADPNKRVPKCCLSPSSALSECPARPGAPLDTQVDTGV